MAQKPSTLAGAFTRQQAERYGVKFGPRRGDRLPVTSPGDTFAINSPVCREPLFARTGEEQVEYVTGIRITPRDKPAQRITVLL